MSAYRAVVTGASGAIGSACVRLLAERGWQITGIDVADPPSDLESVSWHMADVRDREALGKVAEQYGPVKLLINGAGFGDRAPAAEMTVHQWQSVLDVCLTGTFMTSQAFYPNLCDAHGAVVMNIASLAAQRACALHANYCAAKAGVESLTQVLALEWAADQIRVIAVSPGVVNTPIVRENMAPGSEREKAIIDMTPLGRLFGPKELARLILAYSSDDFSHVTGATLVADGGFATAGGLPQFYD
ncbi:MAG: SDR family NAD(P)-dependent oxidoreductase [bacterium]|nr:SDR family oxidoreductase [Acidimicrobiia bacterium]MCY4649991.1 SDR family NAD(P)-dependent oxidoreductase [bacterium]